MASQWKDGVVVPPAVTPANGSPTTNANGGTKTAEIVINKQQVEALELVLNKVNSRVDYILNAARSMTKEMQSRLTDRRRDYEKECGHPQPGELNAEYYQALYERDPIAARVIEVWPKETWRRTPEVYEDEDDSTTTDFEQSIKDLCADIAGDTYYGGNKALVLWAILENLDIQCGIGRYGILYICVDDAQDPRFPVRGWKVVDSNQDYGEPDETGNPSYINPSYGDYNYNLNLPAQPSYRRETRKDNGLRKLMYLQVYPETMAQVIKWEADPSHPRYGQPVQYLLNTGIPDISMTNGQPPPTKGVVVHWSRVVHVADNVTSNKVLGTPRCQQVVNRILDLKKLYGGSAEMYWLGALPAIIFKSDPALGGDVDINLTVLKDQIERLMNGLQRHAVLNGMDAEGLAPTVVDPRPQIEVQQEAICIKIKVPLRIFKGSERGELSSAQDSVQHSKETRGRDDKFATPSIICAVVSRFIDLEVLVKPGDSGYKVYWPDPDNESPQERANVALTFIQAIAAYIAGGVNEFIPPTILFTQLFSNLFTRAEAETMLEQAKKEYEQRQKDQAAQQLEQQKKLAEAMPKPVSAPNSNNPADPNPAKNGNNKLVTGDPSSTKVGAKQ